MKVARSVAEVLAEHTTLTVECIDRMYLNVYVPLLQRAAGAAYFFRKMRGAAVPSSALMAPMTRRFVKRHRCADPERMQRLADGLTARKVDALLRKWLARLPHPFAGSDRRRGIRYDISILQAEFALTQVFDRPA